MAFAQAGYGHERGQAVLFPGRGGHDRDAVGTPSGLAGVGGGRSFGDRAGPVLLGDGYPPGSPIVANPAQRRRDDTLTQVGQAHPARQPAGPVPSRGLLTLSDRRVETQRLRRPITDVNGPDRFLAESAAPASAATSPSLTA